MRCTICDQPLGNSYVTVTVVAERDRPLMIPSALGSEAHVHRGCLLPEPGPK